MRTILKYIVLFILPFGGVFCLIFYFYKKMKKRDYAFSVPIWKNFTISEIDTTKKGATQLQIKNADFAIKNMLQPLRNLYGKPIHVNSAIRDYVPENGSTTSYHLKGFAFDIEGWNYLNSENIKLAKLLYDSKIPYTEMIIEHGGNWIHVAYNGKNVRETLSSYTGSDGKTHYRNYKF